MDQRRFPLDYETQKLNKLEVLKLSDEFLVFILRYYIEKNVAVSIKGRDLDKLVWISCSRATSVPKEHVPFVSQKITCFLKKVFCFCWSNT